MILPILRAESGGTPEKPCLSCHKGVRTDPAHAGLACESCHADGKMHAKAPEDPKTCLGCHSGYEGILKGPMATRRNEEEIVQRALGKVAPGFFKDRCSGCHLQGCLDCHGPASGAHGVAMPDNDACLACHNGYFTGIEYTGLAVREDHERYQRGPLFRGQHYQRMLPDVHHEKGLSCTACHTMQGHSSGKTAVKPCLSCHPSPSRSVLEHRIAPHMEKMECSTCHSAWAAQEYGTFIIRAGDEKAAKAFKSIRRLGGNDFKGSYLKEYGPPPVGLNAKGIYSPIRPEFIFFFSQTGADGSPHDNVLLGALWKAFFPHTVRRETVLCPSCHNNAKRFIRADPKDDVYNIRKDGLPLASFFTSEGQEVINGSFVSDRIFSERIQKEGTHPYSKLLIEKWSQVLENLP